MARPYWSGTIQISLVSFGVNMFVATEAKSQIRFHQISRSTGERIRQQRVLQSAVDEAPADDAALPTVGKDDIVKGYEYRHGEYVTIEPQELANLRVASKHSISIDQFVQESEIDPAYFEKPYFVAPDGDAQLEAYAVVRKAMQEAGKVGLGKIAFAGREHVIALKASGDESAPGFMAYTLRFQEELRKPQEYLGDIKRIEVQPEQLELAEALIAKRTRAFDPSQFHDGYEDAVRQLVEAKVNNMPLPQDEPAAPKRAQVIDLMAALRNSLNGDAGGDGGQRTRPAAAARKAAPSRAPRTEEKTKREQKSEGPMLVPKQPAAVPKKPAARATPQKAPSRRKSA